VLVPVPPVDHAAAALAAIASGAPIPTEAALTQSLSDPPETIAAHRRGAAGSPFEDDQPRPVGACPPEHRTDGLPEATLVIVFQRV
jgi:hypothetical protein